MSSTAKLAGLLRDEQGPVAFKDAVDEEAVPLQPPTEHDDAISAMPAAGRCKNMQLRCYRGFWVLEDWARGVVAVHRSFAPRPNDVIVASLQKSGTTWLKALTFATMARGVWPPSSQDHPLRRHNPHLCVPSLEVLFSLGRDALLDMLPSPRLLSTHMPLSLLPPPTPATAGCKIVYIWRDQKDRAVSFWHFMKRIHPDLTFSEVYEDFCNGICMSGPVWDNILEFWKASNAEPTRVLFLTYEKVLQDPCDAVKKLAQFLGQPFSGAEEEAGVVTEIADLCSIDNLRNQKANKYGSFGGDVKISHESFFRKGMAGDWTNHMTLEMAERLDSILREKLDGSGLIV
uniref:Sulfotransferase n=1 Tax=Oryza punctata TaxID=4537 RepID=A0A0E0LTG7_ORYPU